MSAQAPPTSPKSEEAQRSQIEWKDNIYRYRAKILTLAESHVSLIVRGLKVFLILTESPRKEGGRSCTDCKALWGKKL